MTREEAIEKLHWFALDNRDKQIIDTAIEVLTSQNLTKPNNTCEVDLISRADAIELCAEAQGRASTKSELKGISKVWQGLLKLPSAEAEWIPCSERLPSKEDCPMDCLVTRKSNFIGNYVDMAVAEANGTWTHEDWDAIVLGDVESGRKTGLISTRDDGIIAWMPLPKPYREDDEDYELATEQMEHDAMYEPTYNPEDGSM